MAVAGSVTSPGDTKEYDLQCVAHLVEVLVSANIRLVRLPYLKMLNHAGRLWPRRQEAESEIFWDERKGRIETALVTLEEIKQLEGAGNSSGPDGFCFDTEDGSVRIVSVSHSWEAQQHPDPWASQLRGLLQHFDSDVCLAELFDDEFWIFVDFICLPQYKRTPLDNQFFHLAMKSMHVLYAHEAVCRVVFLQRLTDEADKQLHPDGIDIFCESTGGVETRPFTELVLNHTPYLQRGWCRAEIQWKSTSRIVVFFAPMIPATFRERVKQGEQKDPNGLVLTFTHRSDAELVMQLQEKVFVQQAPLRKCLDARFLPLPEVLLLAEALPYFVNLESLYVSATNEVNEEGAEALASGIKALTHMRNIYIGARVGDKGAKSLAEAFAYHTHLTHVALTESGIGDEGARALAAALAKCKELVHIELAQNCIGDKGAALLADTFKETKSLMHVVLSQNIIGDEGAIALAAAFKECKKLRHVDVAQNMFGDTGAHALTIAFRECAHLTHVELAKNCFGDATAAAAGAAGL